MGKERQPRGSVIKPDRSLEAGAEVCCGNSGNHFKIHVTKSILLMVEEQEVYTLSTTCHCSGKVLNPGSYGLQNRQE